MTTRTICNEIFQYRFFNRSSCTGRQRQQVMYFKQVRGPRVRHISVETTKITFRYGKPLEKTLPNSPVSLGHHMGSSNTMAFHKILCEPGISQTRYEVVGGNQMQRIACGVKNPCSPCYFHCSVIENWPFNGLYPTEQFPGIRRGKADSNGFSRCGQIRQSGKHLDALFRLARGSACLCGFCGACERDKCGETFIATHVLI